MRVLDFALQNLEIGYHFQSGAGAVREPDRALRQAGADYEVVPLEPNSAHHGFSAGPRLRRPLLFRPRKRSGTTHLNISLTRGRRLMARAQTQSWLDSEAVKAVEAAAIPIVLPNDSLATLGKVVGQLRATPQKYAAVFKRDTRDIDRFQPLARRGRHGVGRHAVGEPDRPACADCAD